MISEEVIVSVIIPCYNQGKFIEEAIESVKEQTLTSWECIIINDGSTDNTEETIKPYLDDKRLTYISQENKGVSYTRNLGIKRSRGKFIQFLDGDDILEANKFLLQVEFLTNNPVVDIVFGSSRYFTDGNFDKKYILNENGDLPGLDVHYSDDSQVATLIRRNLTTICAPLYRRTVFDTDESFKPIVFEDWLFHLECSLKGKSFHFERLPGTTSFIRMSKESQVYRHKRINSKSPEVFQNALYHLLKQYHYNPAFPVRPVPANYKWRKILKSFVPPFFVDVYRSIKERIDKAN